MHSSDYFSELVEQLGWVVSEFILRLCNGKMDGIDDAATVFHTLEILSRVPASQRLFCQHKGVKLLVARLYVTAEPLIKIHAARILANISHRNDEMARLVVEHDAIKPLPHILSSADARHQTAALMALRNHASNDINRNQIVSLGLLLNVIELTSKGKTMRQRVIAAAVLGNLACLPANQMLILHHAGDDALLGIVQKTPTPAQIETVAAALWILTKDDATLGLLREKNGQESDWLSSTTAGALGHAFARAASVDSPRP